jgi:hypothetical protein
MEKYDLDSQETTLQDPFIEKTSHPASRRTSHKIKTAAVLSFAVGVLFSVIGVAVITFVRDGVDARTMSGTGATYIPQSKSNPLLVQSTRLGVA